MTWTDAYQIAAAVLTGLGGGGAIVFGLSSYLGRVWADRQQGEIDARLKRLESALTHKNFIQQRFAELELDAITTCWRTSRQLLPLHYAVRAADSGTDETSLQERARALAESHDEALASLQQHEPFLPQEIADTMDEVLTIVRAELSDIQHHEHFVGPWWDEGQRHHEAVGALTNRMLEQVKTRTSALRTTAERSDGSTK